MNWVPIVAKLAAAAYNALKVYDLLNKTGVIKHIQSWFKRKPKA